MQKINTILLIISLNIAFLPLAARAAEVRNITFPIAPEHDYSFSDDYGDPRSGGRSHAGIDIIVEHMTPLVAAVDGRITFLTETPEPWGMALYIEDADGYSYRYLHINNDTPGTDDNKAIRAYAFPNDIHRGTEVTTGQVVAFAGDSGNAENVHHHLHFEIWTPREGSRYDWDSNRVSINPYASLMASIGKPVVQDTTSPTPSDPNTPSVYQFTRDLKLGSTGEDVRQLQKFLNQNGYKISNTGAGSPGNETTYFGSATQSALIKFQSANNISPASGYFGPITRSFINNSPSSDSVVKSGWLVKDPTSPKVYYVNDSLELQWIVSEQAALSHFGPTWIAQIRDITGLENAGLNYGSNLQ